ncbi:MAG: zinc-ribbon domain-containing protein, partial [Myxococcales bacterium]|nr:zinc-ribbon domain-containing protein [Myxococcales bacterium]
MKFLCDNCKAKYQIPDEKIAGRTLRMKCRKCNHDIIIRGPQEAEPEPAPSPAVGGRRAGGSGVSPAPRARGTRGSHAGPRPSAPASAPRKPSSLGADFRRSSLSPESAPPRAAPEWHVAINDVPVGPIRRDEVARKIGTGAVTGESLCWREGFDDWKPVASVPELASLLQQRRSPPRPSVPPRVSERPGAVVPIGGRAGASAAPAFEE